MSLKWTQTTDNDRDNNNDDGSDSNGIGNDNAVVVMT